MCQGLFWTQVVREKVSTATVLLLAHTAKNLIYFYVRRNAIMLKVRTVFLPVFAYLSPLTIFHY